MGWRQTDVVQERHRMIEDHLSGMFSKVELAARYGVSRPIINYWIEQFKKLGYPGLEDRSHAPHGCPHRTPEQIEALIVKTRQEHPRWGPRTIVNRLMLKDPSLKLPAISTVGGIIKRAGLIVEKRRKRAPGAVHRAAPEVSSPNELWNIDFKGQHRLRCGDYVYPLTVTDTFSRFLLCCDGLKSTHLVGVRASLERVFEEFGLPWMIRSDNGSPFAGSGLWGLSRLNVWWMMLGIAQLLTRRGRPQDNGQHERFHRTLKAETVFPIATTSEEQQERYDIFHSEFNFERTHQGIDDKIPSSLYERSPRIMPTVIKPPQYDGHCEVRKVSGQGSIKFKGHELFLSETLGRELIALEHIDDGVWSIRFYQCVLGRLDERTMTLR